jgi:hypothetical protein
LRVVLDVALGDRLRRLGAGVPTICDVAGVLVPSTIIALPATFAIAASQVRICPSVVNSWISSASTIRGRGPDCCSPPASGRKKDPVAGCSIFQALSSSPRRTTWPSC